MKLGLSIAGLAIAMLAAATTATAQGRRGFAPPTCDVSRSHFLINSASRYLNNAASTRYPDQRERDLRDAERVLNEAILERDQDQNGSAWYYLARYYQEVNDLTGADSAFDRAERMLPGCKDDINTNRRRLWVPLLNRAVDRIRAGDNEQAITVLREANMIFDAEPPAFYYMGQIYANTHQNDSAVAYYEQALDIAELPENLDKEQYDDIRENAAFNIARIYHMDEAYDNAISWYQRFRGAKPNDPQALTGQAAALEAAGRTDEAVALYDSVLVMADSMPTLDLFAAGVAMYRTKRYNRAADAFTKGLERNPYYRDALYNLANTYLSMANDLDSTLSDAEEAAQERAIGDKMEPIARRLVDTDPGSSAAIRLLAAAFQLQGQQDSTLATLERIEAMPFEVTISRFEPTNSGFDVRGILTNLRSEATAVPTLTFEFLTESGEVVQTITVDPQELEADGMAPFALAPVGENIAAWRYHMES